jgi:AcrR family transcriptional regulator
MAGVKRPYDASGRRQQARARRYRVALEARELFERDGYRATTVSSVAAAAGVSPEMVYKSFGTKAALAKAVFDIALAGDDEPVPIRERPAIAAVHEEPDVRRKIAAFVEGLVLRLERSARIQIIIRDGRHVDESLQPVWDELQHEGLTGMRLLGEHLLGTGQLRPGIAIDEVTDLLWNYLAIDHYERLVMFRGWAIDEFAEWLSRAIADALTERGT